MIGLSFIALLLANFALGKAVILYQWDMAGADIGTGTAFNAVKEVVVLGLSKVLGLAIPVQLLW